MQSPVCRKNLFIAALVSALLLAAAGQAWAAVPTDVADHWARPAIMDLVKQGVVVGYPDRTFKPDRALTRAEFAHLADKVFQLEPGGENPFTDTSAHWAGKNIAALAKSGVTFGASTSDKRYRPEQTITRAEMVTMLNQLLKLGGQDLIFGQGWAASFTDVPRSHRAFRAIELARRLGYLPPAYGTSFKPNAVITRAEAAWMFDRISRFVRVRGTVLEVTPDIGTVTVSAADTGETKIYNLDLDALLLRNNAMVSVQQILPGDEFSALVDQDGLVRAAKVAGKLNGNDMAARLNGLTNGLLTPDVLLAITSGDWQIVKDSLKGILFDRLIEMGLGPGEAQSLLDQDWITLDLLSRDQLVTALSGRLGISTDLAAAILAQDLGQIKELLQTELLTLALGRLLAPAA